MKMKILVIRFSSFGDVVQCMSILKPLKELGAEIHWVTKESFKSLVEASSLTDQVITLRQGSGLKELFCLGKELSNNQYTHIYDAHNNLRSLLLRPFLIGEAKYLVRSKNRLKRFFLFWLREDLFSLPFK